MYLNARVCSTECVTNMCQNLGEPTISFAFAHPFFRSSISCFSFSLLQVFIKQTSNNSNNFTAFLVLMLLLPLPLPLGVACIRLEQTPNCLAQLQKAPVFMGRRFYVLKCCIYFFIVVVVVCVAVVAFFGSY